MMNKNERDGKIDQITGKVKEAVGNATGNERLKSEGEADQVVGKAQSIIGAAQHKVGDAIQSVGKSVKR